MLAKVINCPNIGCGQSQLMVYHKEDNIWFPVRPYCCIVMECLDTTQWNQLLDDALRKTGGSFIVYDKLKRVELVN